MRRRYAVGGLLVAAAAVLLAVPGSALADATDLEKSIAGKLDPSVGINTMWVIVAGALVMFMQAGFAFLEIGFSRGKNAGTVVAKILTNFSIAAVGWWVCGFALRVRRRQRDRARRRVLLLRPRPVRGDRRRGDHVSTRASP